MTVNSGNGKHDYFIFKDPFRITSPEDLERIKGLSKGFMDMFVQIASNHGWSMDNVSSPSQVVRIPGTINRKTTPVESTIERYDPSIRYTVEEIEEFVKEWREKNIIKKGKEKTSPDAYKPAPVPSNSAITTTESSQLISRTYEERYDADYNRIYNGCPFVKHCEDKAACLSEPEWVAHISLLAHCLNGRALTHLTSSPYPKYSFSETEKKFNHILKSFKPMSCIEISKASSDPTLCNKCQFKEKLRSPIQLGRPFIPDTEIINCLQRNQVGDANILTKLLRGLFCYDCDRNKWFAWNGYYWEEDVIGNIYKGVEFVRNRYIAASVRIKDEDTEDNNKERGRKKQNVKEKLKRRVEALNGIERIEKVLKLAGKGDDSLAVRGDVWDRNEMLLACQSGIIDLTTGMLRRGRPEDFIKCACPTEWKGIDTPAPRWEQFLNEIFNDDQDMIGYFKRFLGYAITGKRIEHTFPIWWGEDGRNGKSTCVEVLMTILGNSICGPVQSELIIESAGKKTSSCPTPEILRLQGMRFVWASEISDGSQLNLGKMHALTGGDSLTARTLHSGNYITFQPSHKLILLTNFKPTVRGDSKASWDRIRLIPFNVRFVDEPKGPNEKKKDKELYDKLMDEKSGILAALVRYCLEFQRLGLNPPQSVLAATEDYRSEEDILQGFLDERTIPDRTSKVKSSDLYKVYTEWCKESGLGVYSRTRFGKAIKRKLKSETSGYVYYTGIKLIESLESPIVPSHKSVVASYDLDIERAIDDCSINDFIV